MDSRYLFEAIDIDDIPEENKNGNCFVVALNKFMEKPYQYTLVHGVVTGQGAIEGLQYCHAWVEDGNTVIDMTLPERMRKFPREVYYAIGKIDITRKYSGKEVLDMVEKYMTYGPWDKVFERYY